MGVSALGSVKFYCAVVGEGFYQKMARQRPGLFPFSPGTDRASYQSIFEAPARGPYRVVLRLGMFSPAGKITLRVEQMTAWEDLRPPRSPSPPR